ncbi:MAG: hypothetical protein LCH86_09580 [Proteobacteria bacterium]|nr:hypothetical protein [Pseudomonadota bacterium]
MLLFIDDRAPVTLVATATDTVDRSGSYTFAGLNFGDDYSNRTLVACIGLFAGSEQVLNQTSVTIGGSSASGDDSGSSDPAGGVVPGSAAGCGVWAAKPAGTSGSVVVNFTSGTAGSAVLYLFSIYATSATPFGQLLDISAGPGVSFPDSDSGTMAVPAEGVIIGGCSRALNTGPITLTGLTQIADVTIDSVHRFAVGYAQRLAANGSYPIGFTTATGNTVYGMRAASFS